MSFGPLSYLWLFPIFWLFQRNLWKENTYKKVCQLENGVIDILDASHCKCLMVSLEDCSEDPDVDQIDSGAGF